MRMHGASQKHRIHFVRLADQTSGGLAAFGAIAKRVRSEHGAHCVVADEGTAFRRGPSRGEGVALVLVCARTDHRVRATHSCMRVSQLSMTGSKHCVATGTN